MKSDLNTEKHLDLMTRIVDWMCGPDDIVLDFFAGAGTTGHAVMAVNSRDDGRRRYVLVQFPEPVQSGKFKNIAEMTKERLRQSATKVKNENPMFAGDTGFRVFKVQDTLRTAIKDGTLVLPKALEIHLAAVREVLKKVAGKLDIKNADERIVVKTRQAVLESAEFQALWDRIKHKTTYRVHFDNEKLVVNCGKAIAGGPPVSKARVRIRKADLSIGQGGVEATERRKDSGTI